MRIIAIVAAILLLSGYPVSSEVVLTDGEAAELETILKGQVAMSERLVELSREQRQLLEKSMMDSIALLRSIEMSKAWLEGSKTELNAASISLQGLEREKELYQVLALSTAAALVLDIILRLCGK